MRSSIVLFLKKKSFDLAWSNSLLESRKGRSTELALPVYFRSQDTKELSVPSLVQLVRAISKAKSVKKFSWVGYGEDLSDQEKKLVASENVGYVASFKDSIVSIKGITGVKANELIYFEGGASGIALNLEYNVVRGLVFGGPKSVRTLESVTRSNLVMSVGVGSNVLNRVMDPLGRALDGKGEILFVDRRPIEKKAPGVIEREKIATSLPTGLKVVDALVPIGRGQRELILGDRKTGKTTIAIDTMLNQRNALMSYEKYVNCIYVAVGKRMSEIVRLSRTLFVRGAANFSAIVVARASDPASLQFIAPYSACTMAEYFSYIGSSSLIIFDDLTRHADAYRQISLLLRRPVGREAFPGDVFFLHSRLLERASMLSAALGRGSLTALPIIETVQGDVSAYIPTNVISITDGQIYLNQDRHQEGVRPAVDPGLSVSRVGSAAQAKLMKRIAGSLKLGLAQYREVEQFSKFGSELDAATRKLLASGQLLIELFKQDRNKPLPFYQQIFILVMCGTDFFEEVIMPNMHVVGMDLYWESLGAYLRYSRLLFPYKDALGIKISSLSLLRELLTVHFKFFMFHHAKDLNFDLSYIADFESIYAEMIAQGIDKKFVVKGF